MNPPLRLLITFDFPPLLKAAQQVEGYTVDVAPSREAAMEKLVETDVACVTNFDAELLARGRKLKWVQALLGGVERVLFPELITSPISLTCVKECFAAPGADHAMASILAVAYRLDYYLRQQSQRSFRWDPPSELAGKTLGIIGLGNIGRALAMRAKAFSMSVLAVARRPALDPAPADAVFPPAQLDEVLRQSDFVVIAIPLTPETRGMIGAAQLRWMKPTAHLIDISGRPGILDQGAVIDALREGRLGGADLQFDRPPPPDSPLWTMNNLLMSQYSANSREETERSVALVRENLVRFRDGQSLVGVVDKVAGY